MSWTDVTDVTDRWVGAPHSFTDEQIEKKIGDAERIIRRRDPKIQSRIVDDETPPPWPPRAVHIETVKQVVAAMVIRHLQNPLGERQVSESDGPFSRSRTLAGDAPGRLMLDPEDKRQLGIRFRGKGQAFVVPMRGGGR